MEKLKCTCGEEFYDESCFVAHWRGCSSSSSNDGLYFLRGRVKELEICLEDITILEIK